MTIFELVIDTDQPTIFDAGELRMIIAATAQQINEHPLPGDHDTIVDTRDNPVGHWEIL